MSSPTQAFSVQRDRIAIIKRAHLLGSEKRKYVLKNPRPKMSPEERLERRRECQRERVKRWAESLVCIKCGRNPVIVQHTHEGNVLFSKRTAFCPKHTKGKHLNAIPIPTKSI